MSRRHLLLDMVYNILKDDEESMCRGYPGIHNDLMIQRYVHFQSLAVVVTVRHSLGKDRRQPLVSGNIDQSECHAS